MTKPFRFEREHDVYNKLVGSIIFDEEKDSFVYVIDNAGYDLTLQPLRYIEGVSTYVKSCEDESLKIFRPQLGLVLAEGVSFPVFFSIEERQTYRYGIPFSMIKVRYMCNTSPNIKTHSIIMSEDFDDMLRDNYMHVKDATEFLFYNEGMQGVPVSKFLFLQKPKKNKRFFGLKYATPDENISVGLYDIKKNHVFILERYKHVIPSIIKKPSFKDVNFDIF